MQHRTHRYQTSYPIQVATPTGPRHCRICDVNAHGARLNNSTGLQRGDKIRFRVLHLDIIGVIRWINGDQAGLIFRPALTQLAVDTLRYRRDKPQVAIRNRVGFQHLGG